MGNIDVSIPDGPDRTLFRDRSGEQHLIVHIYTGTLCQIFYRPGFLIDPLAFHCNCGEDNGDLSVAGYPIAYYIARSEQKKQNALILVITIPMWINMLVRTYAWIGLLSDGGLIQRILHMVGLGKGSLLYTEGAVLLGMVYNFLPFMILQIQTSLSKMDNSLLEASADLGASPAQTFKRVTLPLSVPGIINGITLVFLPAVSSFFIPKLLGGGQYFLIGNMIENQFITVGEWNFGSAISMIMAVIMMVLMMVVRKIEIRNQGGKGV